MRNTEGKDCVIVVGVEGSQGQLLILILILFFSLWKILENVQGLWEKPINKKGDKCKTKMR